ncbi:MAG TPA: ATP-binding protein [Bacteroidales bacterium]|nr:ATP-binding protein [Bacteroidales bacterium]
MKILISYTKKWLIYIVSFFILFAGIMFASEFFHEKKYRSEALNGKLDDYVRIIHQTIEKDGSVKTNKFGDLDSLIILMANRDVRITVIRADGVVLYDSWVRNTSGMENHLYRPEIQEALQDSVGSDIRVSETTHIKYYYYARNYNGYFVRVSDRYDLSARKLVEPDRLFLVFLILLLLSASLTIILLTDRFGKSINTLRNFTLKALENKPIEEKFEFPQNELGNLGQEIIEIYQNLNRTKEELISEKAKLIRHLNLLDEGIAIFSRDKQVITSNNHFIRFINFISDTRVFTADEFFRISDFNSIFAFIDRYLKDFTSDTTDLQPTYEVTMNKGGRFFSVKCIVFQDKSFEISVNDISKLTKRKILKQQITENISHELKTPVSSIKGFLETILEGKPDKARTQEYLKRAYFQACRLADLVHDISLLTKIEEAGSLYQIEDVDLSTLVSDIVAEMQLRLEGKNIRTVINMPENMHLQGNGGLLYSIFRNLYDNAIDHAGENLEVRLDHYLTDPDFHYFSFSDNGTGVPEEDLPRLFERFYRVDKGRDRKKGGTGLGLAIVKNAVQFHKGDISVKNRTGGGLEFLFTLARDVRTRTE